jgi:hypothetical protein
MLRLILSFAMIAMFTATLVGCHASADVGHSTQVTPAH